MSSRTYLSTLERGLKSPTIEKIEQLAGAMSIHPLTLLVATYLGRDDQSTVDSLFQTISDELGSIVASQASVK